MSALSNGSTPLISAKGNNNGLKTFVDSSKKLINGNCITLNNDGDGGAGLAYYQPHKMAVDTHVTALIPKCVLNKWSMLFIARCLSGLHEFFGHGLSISNSRAENIMIMLPVTKNDKPDYKLMETVGKIIMKEKYRCYLSYVNNFEPKKMGAGTLP